MPSPSEPALARSWLVRLRWGAVGGQLLAVGFAVSALHLPVPVLPIGAVIAATALSNLALGRSERAAAIPIAVLLDLGFLTVLLTLTGGASNPFSVLYLLHVALAAVLLGPRWTAAMVVLAIAGFAALFPFTDPHAMHGESPDGMRVHLWGMWVAFALTGGGIAWFVARLATALRAREAELERLQRASERQARVVSLATLAAGAAHELGSPLSAIAVSARELEILAEATAETAMAEEARAVRTQVARCRDIVGRLTAQAGAAQGEAVETSPAHALWTALRARLGEREAARVCWSAAEDLALVAPQRALTEALASLLQNALLAGPGPVRLSVASGEDGLRFRVDDQGAGMSPEVLAHLGEPFFTTRPPGAGMGLGVFLARRFAEDLGGSLELDSREGQGTRAVLTLPRPA